MKIIFYALILVASFGLGFILNFTIFLSSSNAFVGPLISTCIIFAILGASAHHFGLSDSKSFWVIIIIFALPTILFGLYILITFLRASVSSGDIGKWNGAGTGQQEGYETSRSKLPTHAPLTEQKIVTEKGTVTFVLGENIDYENGNMYVNNTDLLNIVFVPQGSVGKVSGKTVQNSDEKCSMGEERFLEMHDDVALKTKEEGDVRTEKFGSNTYTIFEWKYDPRITFYQLAVGGHVLTIEYANESACTKDIDYSTDLRTLLETLQYEPKTSQHNI